MRLDQIVIDAGTQARHQINDDIVKDYAERMEEGDKFPPVVVFHDGSDYYLADGFHRVLAAECIGREEFPHKLKKGTKQAALWYAMGANKTNGIRMSRGDVRHAVKLALETWPEKTQQAIAKQVGCSQRYVGDIQKELRTTSKLTIPNKRTGADGKERPTTYKKQKPRKERGEAKKPRLSKEQCAKLPPCFGNMQAQRAIWELEEIEPNDTERVEGLERVERWIHENK